MNWFGLDWLGLILAVLVLAIIPGLLAAYGGNIAAEAIGDPKRSRNVKYCFWGLFVFGVLATSWQQFRSAVSDLDRDTKEKWAETVVTSKFLPPPPPANIEHGKSQIIPRSYILVNVSFPERRDTNGQLAQDQHFQVGDILSLNVHFKCSGPNPVELVRHETRLYVASSLDPDVQNGFIADFEDKLSKPSKAHLSTEPSTMMPGEGRFATAFAFAESGEFWKITTADLNQFRVGTKVPLVIAQITYKDKSVTHHARRCVLLQPPADPPGIWDVCGRFNKSD